MGYSREFEVWFEKQRHLSWLENKEIEELKKFAWQAWKERDTQWVQARDRARFDFDDPMVD